MPPCSRAVWRSELTGLVVLGQDGSLLKPVLHSELTQDLDRIPS